MSTPSRRFFLGATALAAGAHAVAANERIRLGAIGTGARGKGGIRDFVKLGAEVVAVCDIYDVRRAEALKLSSPAAEAYGDYRRVLERKDIDAVYVATPDHWHSRITVDAIRAGKDVYVEKPMTSRIGEGLEVVKAVRGTKQLLCVGTQQRSGPHWLEAKKRVVDTGLLGKIGLVRTWYNANAGYQELKAPPGFEKKPDGLDWDRYLGPLPKMPWDPNKYFSPYKWMDIDGGMVNGIFIHQLDSVHQFLNLTNPLSVMSGGGIYHYKDGRDTPDVVNCILEYPRELNVTFEGECLTRRGTESKPSQRNTAGVEFHGTGGILTVLRYSSDIGWEFAPSDPKAERLSGPGDPGLPIHHMRHFLECLRTRKKPISNEETGYYSAMACHMANLAWKTRTRVTWKREWSV